jgi:hypothetical protein
MFFYIHQDFARPFQLNFQDTATPVMSSILDLHSYVCFFLIVIFIFVAFQIYDVLNFFRIDYYYFSPLTVDTKSSFKKMNILKICKKFIKDKFYVF